MSEATVSFYEAQVRSPFGTCLNDLSLALVHIIATATTGGGVFFQASGKREHKILAYFSPCWPILPLFGVLFTGVNIAVLYKN